MSFLSFLGSGPDRGRSPVEWGDFPSVRSFVRSFVRTYVCPSVPPLGHPAGPEAQPARPEAQPARPEAQPASQPTSGFRPGWLGLRPGWMAQRGDVRTNERTNVRTENLPILQDFIPYRGRCPKRGGEGRKGIKKKMTRGKELRKNLMRKGMTDLWRRRRRCRSRRRMYRLPHALACQIRR